MCGVHEYASAQFLDYLELAENCAFLDRKLVRALNETVEGHEVDYEVANTYCFPELSS